MNVLRLRGGSAVAPLSMVGILGVLLCAAPAVAGEAGGDGSAFPPAHGRLNLRLFGPLAPDPKAFHQDFGGAEAGGFIPKGSHSDAPIEWGLTAGGFLLGAGVSLTINVIFNGMANDWMDDTPPTAAIDARAGTGLMRIAVNAPLVGLAIWGLNLLSENHSVPYLWPYLAGLVCDVIIWAAQIGLTAGKVGVPEAPAAPGGAASGTKVKAAFDVIFLILGSIAVPLAETIMAQRVRDPPITDGGVILGSVEPEELRGPLASEAFAPTATVYTTRF